MKKFLVLCLLIIAVAAHASTTDNPYKGYLKLHPGLTVQPGHYSLSLGGSYGVYLTDQFGIGLGGRLYTYEHQEMAGMLAERLTGGGAALFIEALMETSSRKIALTGFGGAGLLNVDVFITGNGDEAYVDGYAKYYPLMGVGLDYYPTERLSIGLRTCYSFLGNTHVVETIPQVGIALSLGTRF